MNPKVFLLFGLALSTLAMTAQPVINSEDFTNAGDVFEYSQLPQENLSDMDVLVEGGEDLIWDFSEISTEGIILTESYFPMDSTPELFSLFFGNPILSGDNFSSHALSINTLDLELPLPLQVENGFQFYRNDEEGYFITGNAAEIEGLPLISAYDTLDKVFSFPITYGQAEEGSFYFLTEVPGIGVVGQAGQRATVVDAWGDLITPYGTYECLRVRTELAVTDTFYLNFTQSGETFVRPLQVSYSWISPEAGGVLAEAVFFDEAITGFRFLTDEGVLNLNNRSETEFSIYPNPTSSELNISLPHGKSAEFLVMDLTGREVLKFYVRSTQVVDISTLNEGLYLIAPSRGGTVKRLVIKR